MITSFNKTSISRPMNDNIHCFSTWEFVYSWSEKERNKKSISSDRWNEQRVVHYLYEILNRPWLSDAKKIIQAKAWLRHETIFTPNIISDASLREILDISSGRTQIIYDNERQIEQEAERSSKSSFQAYINLLHSN